ncbi:hypothetical protein [Paenibacillus qinlingensis]|uniref:Peptidoglycan/LPS O-acetylase OafA/YrhL n=1 Tax=Paenibacillus qinlingensis TaxID=1837343 RepID=A0ABU1NXT2_9BACL|nr:hypothetical protein [Paenibacillus qinlingensis]MDR6551647.1 peptidoglycan/LPS O-acetylase OafA/YrhL [Paenibacillus qinlingensis]
MKLLAYFTRTILVLATLGALMLLGLAFLFNDTSEPAYRLLAIWGGYPLIGLILIIVNEKLLRKAFANRSFRTYGLFWACVVIVVLCAWAISAYF